MSKVSKLISSFFFSTMQRFAPYDFVPEDYVDKTAFLHWSEVTLTLCVTIRWLQALKHCRHVTTICQNDVWPKHFAEMTLSRKMCLGVILCQKIFYWIIVALQSSRKIWPSHIRYIVLWPNDIELWLSFMSDLAMNIRSRCWVPDAFMQVSWKQLQKCTLSQTYVTGLIFPFFCISWYRFANLVRFSSILKNREALICLR